MDKTQLIQRLMVTFLEEMEEHVRALNEELLALEREPDAPERGERFKRLFRTAHSLKGAARSVNVLPIERACHYLEEILTAARDRRLDLTADQFALLFAVADALEEAGMRLREQQDLGDAPLVAMVARLESVAAEVASRPRPTSEQAAAAPASSAPVAAAPAAEAPAALPGAESSRAQQDRGSTLMLRPPASPESTSRPAGGDKPGDRSAERTSTGSSVRVAAEKLDRLLARSGELLIARRRVEARLGDLAALQDLVEQWRSDWQRLEKTAPRQWRTAMDNSTLQDAAGRWAANFFRQTGSLLQKLRKDVDLLARGMRTDVRLLDQVAGPLDEEVRAVRMLPFTDACAGLDRLARDLAQASGKEVELTIEGETVELDRSILEGLKDPLRHLVRNAVDHGVEDPARRHAAGKPAQARILVRAALRGAQVEITVEDDGRGLDLQELRAQARRRHLPEPADDAELVRLIFLPGFSTAPLITDVSGRGVGLDVVKSRVESLHGTVDVRSVPNAGVRFTLVVPLTLTTLRALLVVVGDQTYAFAGTNVRQLTRLDLSELHTVAGRETLSLGGAALPFAHLASVFQPDRPLPQRRGKTPIVVVAAGDKQLAFAVDEFVAEQEIVVKGLGQRIRHLPLVSGATVLPSGRVALVLNAAHVVRSALKDSGSRGAVPETAPTRRKRVLVVEDSLTTRTLEKTILESAGYDVLTAVDGQAAWDCLQEQPVDLVVSDVEMPRMDGFVLTETIRGSARQQALPVVLVTSRESEADKARGLAVGANAYLVKSTFDQRALLETIAQLV